MWPTVRKLHCSVKLHANMQRKLITNLWNQCGIWNLGWKGCWLGGALQSLNKLVLTENSTWHHWIVLDKLKTNSWKLRSPPVFSGVRVTRSLVLLIVLLFHLAIVLSVLRYTDSDYPFGIFKLLLEELLVIFWKNISLMVRSLIKDGCYHIT